MMEEETHEALDWAHGIQTKQGFDIRQTLVTKQINLGYAGCFAA